MQSLPFFLQAVSGARLFGLRLHSVEFVLVVVESGDKVDYF
jgi:hypothetical protein